MKKIISILAGVSILLTGCGNVQEVTSTAEVQTVPETVRMTENPEELPETETPEETTPETTIPEVTVPDTTQAEETDSDTSEPEETVPEMEEEYGWWMPSCDPRSNSAVERETKIVPQTEEISAPEEVTELETEEIPETEQILQKPDKGVAVNVYISAIQDKIAAAKQFSAGSGDFTVTYSLYDMNADGTPELLVQYGTCEADYQIAIYTIRDNSLKQIADNLGGGHTSFAYDYVANQLVLANGHMGYGIMTWYDLDENGDLRFLIDTDGFEFGGDSLPDYAEIMKNYNVAWLDGAQSFSIGGEVKTYLYTYSGNEYNSQEYSGLDFRYLQDYPF